MSLEEAADKLGLSSSTLRSQVAAGKFNAQKVGRFYVVEPAEVERYRRENLGKVRGWPKGKKR